MWGLPLTIAPNHEAHGKHNGGQKDQFKWADYLFNVRTIGLDFINQVKRRPIRFASPNVFGQFVLFIFS